MSETEVKPEAKRAKKSRHGEGRMYSVNGRWYLRFMFRRIMQPRVLLNKPDGTPCTNKVDAQSARKAHLEKFKAIKVLAGSAQSEAEEAKAQALRDAKKSPAGIIQVSEGLYIFKEKLANAGKLPRPDTLRAYESIYSSFSNWASKRVAFLYGVTEDVAESYMAYLNRERKVSARTFNHHIGFLRHLWKVIRKPAGLGDRANPWGEIERRKADDCKRVGFTAQEARAIIELAMLPEYRKSKGVMGEVTKNGELATLFALSFYLGSRMGDTCSFKWQNFDLEKKRVDFVAHKTKSKQAVWLHPALVRWLGGIPGPHTGYVMPALAELYAKKSYHVCVVAKQVFTDAGIQTNEEKEEASVRCRVIHGLHSFRHGFGTLATENGASLTAVQAVLGHSAGTGSRQTAHYAHLSAEAGRPAVEALPDILEGLAPVK